MVEISIVAWEIRQHRKLVKLGQAAKGTEADRRDLGVKVAWLGMSAMSVFIGLLFLGLIFLEGRTCNLNQALEDAVCVDCQDSNCRECRNSS